MCTQNACLLLDNDECGETGTGCDNNRAIWCENGDYLNPLSYDCNEDNLVCVRDSTDKPPYCALGCTEKKLGDIIVDGCEDPNTVKLFECKVNVAKRLLILNNTGATYYYEPRTEKCEHGCDPAAGDCIVIHPEEYKDCDDSYVPSCYNNVFGYCGTDKTVHATDCAAQDQVCGIAHALP